MDAWLDDAVDRVSKYAYGGSSPGYHVVPKTSGAVRLLPFYNSGVVGFSGVNFALKVAVRIPFYFHMGNMSDDVVFFFNFCNRLRTRGLQTLWCSSPGSCRSLCVIRSGSSSRSGL